MTANLEVVRVADHILRAETMAKRRDTSQLSHVQKLVRALLLQALADYRAGGQFPKNRDFKKLTPYFIDADGTRCAMAHLLELGGQQALVDKISRERNNAYVRELADEGDLIAWLQASGLTVEEAAAIQPGYCSLITDCICGGDFANIQYPVPARGALEGVVQANGKLRIDAVYGDGLGITVGMEVTMATTGANHAAGAHVVAPIDSASTAVHAIALDLRNEYICHSQGVSETPPLTAGEFAHAVMANDCPGELRAQSRDWEGSSCEGEDMPLDDNGGCSTTSADASVGVLLAVVAALAARRR